MKNLLNVAALITLMFFCYENTFAQNITATPPLTVKGKTPVETSTTLEAPIETAKLIRGDGINA